MEVMTNTNNAYCTDTAAVMIVYKTGLIYSNGE